MPLDLLAAYGAGYQIHAENLAAHLAGREHVDETRWDELAPAYQNWRPRSARHWLTERDCTWCRRYWGMPASRSPRMPTATCWRVTSSGRGVEKAATDLDAGLLTWGFFARSEGLEPPTF